MSVPAEIVIDGETFEDQPQDDEVFEEAVEDTEGVEEDAEVESEPEPAEEEAPKADQRQVPLAALHEERQRRQAKEQELAQLRENQIRMEERFRAFQERITAAQQPAQPEVSYDEDPAEYLRQRQEKLERTTAELASQRQASEQERQIAVAFQQFSTQLRRDEQAYAQQHHEDYFEAVDFLKQARAQELSAIGVDAAEVEQALVREAIYVAQQAAMKGKSPPQAYYEMAKARGYAQKAREVAKPTSTDNVQKVAAGQRRAAGMGSSGGSGDGDLTLAKLANMSDEEFDKATAGDRWRKLWN